MADCLINLCGLIKMLPRLLVIFVHPRDFTQAQKHVGLTETVTNLFV